MIFSGRYFGRIPDVSGNNKLNDQSSVVFNGLLSAFYSSKLFCFYWQPKFAVAGIVTASLPFSKNQWM